MPRPIIQRLHAEVVRVLSLPYIRSSILETASEVGGDTPEEFAACIRMDRERTTSRSCSRAEASWASPIGTSIPRKARSRTSS
jgi:hypothetical protein